MKTYCFRICITIWHKLRTWIAFSLMNSHIEEDPLNWTVHQPNTPPSRSPHRSNPSSLISWESMVVNNNNSNTPTSLPSPTIHQQLTKTTKPVCGRVITLNPLAIPFYPWTQKQTHKQKDVPPGEMQGNTIGINATRKRHQSIPPLKALPKQHTIHSFLSLKNS